MGCCSSSPISENAGPIFKQDIPYEENFIREIEHKVTLSAFFKYLLRQIFQLGKLNSKKIEDLHKNVTVSNPTLTELEKKYIGYFQDEVRTEKNGFFISLLLVNDPPKSLKIQSIFNLFFNSPSDSVHKEEFEDLVELLVNISVWVLPNLENTGSQFTPELLFHYINALESSVEQFKSNTVRAVFGQSEHLNKEYLLRILENKHELEVLLWSKGIRYELWDIFRNSQLNIQNKRISPKNLEDSSEIVFSTSHSFTPSKGKPSSPEDLSFKESSIEVYEEEKSLDSFESFLKIDETSIRSFISIEDSYSLSNLTADKTFLISCFELKEGAASQIISNIDKICLNNTCVLLNRSLRYSFNN